MNIEEAIEELLKEKYATGVTIYFNKKYKTYTVRLHRNRRRTVEAMMCKDIGECVDKIKNKIREVSSNENLQMYEVW